MLLFGDLCRAPRARARDIVKRPGEGHKTAAKGLGPCKKFPRVERGDLKHYVPVTEKLDTGEDPLFPGINANREWALAKSLPECKPEVSAKKTERGEATKSNGRDLGRDFLEKTKTKFFEQYSAQIWAILGQ